VAVAFLCSFNKFDVRYVQHQFFRALALRAQETLQPHFAAEGPSCNQSRVRLECDGADLGFDFPLAAGLGLLGFVAELELERRDARGRQAQDPQLKQPAAQL